MKRYYFNNLNIGHLLVGGLLLFVPLSGMWSSDNVSRKELVLALVLWIPAALILFGRRGISFTSEPREFRIWYGFGFTRSFALPLWRAKPARFQFVAVRLKTTGHPKTTGSSLGSKFPMVWMDDEEGTWVGVASAWTIAGAHQKAARIAAETGLPVH